MYSTDKPARVPGKSIRKGVKQPEGKNNPAPTPLKDKKMGAGSRKPRKNGGPC